ncbi:hypothetical protein [Streptomyces sp. CAU 1734]|uniref:hypothetical protein n=1 Tax=Streptomyces sp. CAU 1734 TaxID=3140360 RepID=UPI0032609AEE
MIELIFGIGLGIALATIGALAVCYRTLGRSVDRLRAEVDALRVEVAKARIEQVLKSSDAAATRLRGERRLKLIP